MPDYDSKQERCVPEWWSWPPLGRHQGQCSSCVCDRQTGTGWTGTLCTWVMELTAFRQTPRTVFQFRGWPPGWDKLNRDAVHLSDGIDRLQTDTKDSVSVAGVMPDYDSKQRLNRDAVYLSDGVDHLQTDTKDSVPVPWVTAGLGQTEQGRSDVRPLQALAVQLLHIGWKVR